MANIIQVINQIGDEVETALDKREHDKYFMLTVLIFSLTENLLKWMVATKECWDESCKQVDMEQEGKKYQVDFEDIRRRVINYNFKSVIERAFKQKIVSENLVTELHLLREDRNDLIHQLWLFEKRSDSQTSEKNLIEAKRVVLELIKHFEALHYEEIGVTVPEVEETL